MALPLLFGGEWHEFDSQVNATTVFRQFETLCAVHETANKTEIFTG